MATRRQQRRARRAQHSLEPAAAGAGAPPARPARPVRPDADEPARRREPAPREAPPRGSFIRESWGELKKVEWPGRNQLVQGTIVVLIAVAIVGAYLWVADLAFENLVKNILL